MGELELRNGSRFAYQVCGRGRPLVFVHGWATHGGFFKPQRQGLSRMAQVITFDLRGHGRSVAGGGPPTIADLAEDVSEFFTRLHLKDAVAVGWSMGATVLWEAVHRHIGDCVAGLVIEDMSPRILNDAEWRLGLADGLEAEQLPAALDAMTRDWRTFCALTVSRMFARGLDRQVLMRWALAEVMRNDPHTMASLWRSMAEQDCRPLLPQIHIPTLVLYGRRSQLYGEQTSAAIVEAMPRATRVGFAHSGHAPHLEEPERFNQIVGSFSRQIGRRGSGAGLQPSVSVL